MAACAAAGKVGRLLSDHHSVWVLPCGQQGCEAAARALLCWCAAALPHGSLRCGRHGRVTAAAGVLQHCPMVPCAAVGTAARPRPGHDSTGVLPCCPMVPCAAAEKAARLRPGRFSRLGAVSSERRGCGQAILLLVGCCLAVARAGSQQGVEAAARPLFCRLGAALRSHELAAGKAGTVPQTSPTRGVWPILPRNSVQLMTSTIHELDAHARGQ